MLRKLRGVLYKEYLLGFAVAGGFIYTNRGEFLHLFRHYLSLVNEKSGVSDKDTSNVSGTGLKNKPNGLAAVDHSGYVCTISDNVKQLRTGDLVFIRYNVEKHNRVDRFKIIAARLLSRNRYHDDVAVVYKKQEHGFFFFMPSVTVDIRDVKLSCNLPCRPNSLDRCTLVEPQQFVKQFAPEMITVKRLICDDIRRQCVNNTIEHLCEAPVTSIHSHMVDVWRSWRDPARVDPSTYQKSETYSGSTDLRKSALIPQDFGVWGLKYSPSDTTQRSYHLSGKSKSDKVSDRGFKSNPADYMATLQAVNEGRHMPDDVAIAVCGLDGKTATLAKRIVGAADLVAHIYSISGLIPETDVSRKFAVADLYNVEFLHARTGHEVVRPRLSNPFSLYSGAFNRTALENLREWPNLDVLKNRM